VQTIAALSSPPEGRAKRAQVQAALQAQNPLEALITISPDYADRARDLRDKLKQMTDAGLLGNKVYRKAEQAFE
jgi:hypothetical protein